MKTFNTVLAWVWLHMPQISATAALLVMLLRAIPTERWLQLEADWPRVANVARLLRALFPDIIKAGKALYSVWTGKPWPLDAPNTTPKPPPLPILLMLVLALSCSSSAQQTQARVLDTIGRISNATITQLEQEYRRQQLEVADEACGHATPCADPEEAAAAVRVIRDQWRPVWSALALLRTSHDVYASQVEACRLADVCTVDFARMGADILRHQSELRCALRAIRVTDPFPGTVSCPGLDAGVEHE